MQLDGGVEVSDHDILMNTSWWADALRQRRELDRAAHAEARAHQAADPESLAADHGASDYALTAWERAWITDRINDAHALHLTQRNDGRAILAEPEDEHLQRELDARARDYFGAGHDETRAKLHAKRAEHRAAHDRAHLLEHRGPDGHAKKIDADALALVRTQLTDSITSIDSYIDEGGLIDRHIATVQVEVAETRRQAQKKVDDCAGLLAVPYTEHVERELARVQDELRKAR